jgi:hypothetical protein
LTKSWILSDNRWFFMLDSWFMLDCEQNHVFYCSRSDLVWELCLLGSWYMFFIFMCLIHFNKKKFKLLCFSIVGSVSVLNQCFRVNSVGSTQSDQLGQVNLVRSKPGYSLGLLWFAVIFVKVYLVQLCVW